MVFIQLLPDKYVYTLDLNDLINVKGLLAFINGDTGHFTFDQLILTNEIDGSWLIQVRDRGHGALRYWATVTDGQKDRMVETLINANRIN